VNLRALLPEKPVLVILSLMMSAVIWLFVSLETSDELEIAVPITYTQPPDGLAVRADKPASVSVRVTGAKIMLIRQRMLDQLLEIDLSGVRRGNNLLTGFEHKVRLVPGVHVKRVHPAVIELKIIEK